MSEEFEHCRLFDHLLVLVPVAFDEHDCIYLHLGSVVVADQCEDRVVAVSPSVIASLVALHPQIPLVADGVAHRVHLQLTLFEDCVLRFLVEECLHFLLEVILELDPEQPADDLQSERIPLVVAGVRHVDHARVAQVELEELADDAVHLHVVGLVAIGLLVQLHLDLLLSAHLQVDLVLLHRPAYVLPHFRSVQVIR